MPNWNQLFDHTTEYTRGPHTVDWHAGAWGAPVSVLYLTEAYGWLPLAQVASLHPKVPDPADPEADGIDPTQRATARLFADAHDLLRAVCRVLTVSESSESEAPLAQWNQSPLWAEMRRLACRHVRIGVTGTDPADTVSPFFDAFQKEVERRSGDGGT